MYSLYTLIYWFFALVVFVILNTEHFYFETLFWHFFSDFYINCFIIHIHDSWLFPYYVFCYALKYQGKFLAFVNLKLIQILES